MKTIAQFVATGIHSQAELQDALYTAMRLEFSTLPPYLTAQWSITGGDTGGFVDKMFKMIVKQEMYHFALAGNMLAALGKIPLIDDPGFPVAYPAAFLPGDIAIDPPVELKALSREQVQVFMKIENPQFPPVPNLLAAPGPATIGDFYDTIENAFNAMSGTLVFDPNAKFVTGFGGETFAVKNPGDAVKAIEQIKAEGEGTDHSALQRIGGQLAHFYRFQELFDGKRRSDDPTDPGKKIDFPTAKSFARSTKTPSESTAFNQAFTKLIIGLKAAWSNGDDPDLKAMGDLQDLGVNLIMDLGVEPEFAWAPT